MTDRSAPDVVLRPATIEDSELFLSLRNDPESVRQSGGVGVDPSTHAAWFGAALEDADHHLWVAVCGDRDIGYARLLVEHGVGVISIAILQEERGAGFAPALLRAVQQSACETESVVRIDGVVDPANPASLRAFERVGFSSELRPDGRVAVSWERPT